MLAILILPILVAGYIATSFDPATSLKIKKLDGQKLYIEVSKYGLMIFAVALFLVIKTPLGSTVGLLSGELLELMNEKTQPSYINKASLVVVLSILTIGCAYVAGTVYSGFYIWKASVEIGSEERKKFIANLSKVIRRGGLEVGIAYFNKKKKALDEIIQHDLHLDELRELVADSPLDSFLLESFLQKRFVQLSLKNDKVYIGAIIAMGDIEDDAFKEIAMLPMISGYRDKETRRIHLPNVYPWVSNEEEMQSDDPVLDAVYIPRDEVYSFSGFSLNVYNHVSSDKQLDLYN